MRKIQPFCLALLLAAGLALSATAQPVKLGAGTYFLTPKAGDSAPPPAPGRTDAMLKQAAPTNRGTRR